MTLWTLNSAFGRDLLHFRSLQNFGEIHSREDDGATVHRQNAGKHAPEQRTQVGDAPT